MTLVSNASPASPASPASLTETSTPGAVNSGGSHEFPLTEPVNLRDLGGIPTPDGLVRQGFAIRADDLSTVTESYAEQLVGNGLRAVIDLRSAAELEITGRGPLGAQANVAYHHLPMLTSVGSAADDGHLMDQSSYGGMYIRMFEAAAPQIVSALAVIAYAPGTTAFHCAAGQDRTGVLAAALLLTLGANRESVIRDYVLTGQNSAAIHQRINPVLAPLMRRMGFELNEAARAAMRKEFSEVPMQQLLNTLTERHGDPLNPLRESGLSGGLIATLRERALNLDYVEVGGVR